MEKLSIQGQQSSCRWSENVTILNGTLLECAKKKCNIMGEEARGRMVESNKKRDDSSPRLNNDDAHMRAVSQKISAVRAVCHSVLR